MKEIEMTVQILTANRLGDGAVVYWSKTGSWATQLAESLVFASAEDAAAVLAEAGTPRAALEIVGPYLMTVDNSGGEIRPVETRERIRANGPSVQFGSADRTESLPLSLAG